LENKVEIRLDKIECPLYPYRVGGLPAGCGTILSSDQTLPAGCGMTLSPDQTLPTACGTILSPDQTLPVGCGMILSSDQTLPAGCRTILSPDQTLPVGCGETLSRYFFLITPEWKEKNKIFHYQNLISNLIFLTERP
jgi:hypothetical protein